MACTVTLKGIPYDCEPNLSGVKRVLVADYNDVASFTVDASNNEITAITMDGSTYFYEYTCAKNTANLVSTLTKDEANGTLYYTNELTGRVNHLDESKRFEFSEVSRGQLAVIVTDKNDESWYLGQNDYASCTSLTAQTGASGEDGNFYEFTITDLSNALPYHVDPSIIDDLIG